jgi:hypothetical protein
MNDMFGINIVLISQPFRGFNYRIHYSILQKTFTPAPHNTINPIAPKTQSIKDFSVTFGSSFIKQSAICHAKNKKSRIS